MEEEEKSADVRHTRDRSQTLSKSTTAPSKEEVVLAARRKRSKTSIENNSITHFKWSWSQPGMLRFGTDEGEDTNTHCNSLDTNTKKTTAELFYANPPANPSAKQTAKMMVPIWMADNSVVSCTCCDVQFNLWRRRHHCRACGFVVCDECSNQRTHLPHVDAGRKVRVCTPCLVTIRARAAQIQKICAARPANNRAQSCPSVMSS